MDHHPLLNHLHSHTNDPAAGVLRPARPSCRFYRSRNAPLTTVPGVNRYLAEHPEIVTERLPAYAPELNPDELVWAWTKYGRLGNLAAQHTDWLRDYITTELTYVRNHPELMTSFIEKTNLPLCL